jgi:membrane protein CcdC involved in cytochrome C biogenesis
MGAHSSSTSYLIGVAVFVIVMAIRVSRQRTAKPMNMSTFWLLPALYSVLLGGAVVAMLAFGNVDVTATSAAMLAGSLVVGTGAGWWRGRFMHIEIDEATKKPMVRASGMAFVVLGVLYVVRTGAKLLLFADADPKAPETMLLNAGFLLLALGILVVARVEMYVRARRLLQAAS